MVEFKLTCMCLKYDSDCPICFKNRITDLEKLEMNAAITHVLLYGLAFWPFGDKLGEYICDYKKLGLNYLAHEFIYYYRHGIKHLVGMRYDLLNMAEIYLVDISEETKNYVNWYAYDNLKVKEMLEIAKMMIRVNRNYKGELILSRLPYKFPLIKLEILLNGKLGTLSSGRNKYLKVEILKRFGWIQKYSDYLLFKLLS